MFSKTILTLALFAPAVSAQACVAAGTSSANSAFNANADGTCSVGYYCGSVYKSSAGYLPATEVAVCILFKGTGSACTASSQCGTTYRVPTIDSTTGAITYAATSVNMLSTCKGGRCCKSSFCATSCDENGDCLGDTCTTPPFPASFVAYLSTVYASDANICYHTKQPNPLAAAALNSVGNSAYANAVVCAPNYYGSGGSCSSCPIGATTQFPGATQLSQCQCPANTFGDQYASGGSRCSPCPLGTTSSGGSVAKDSVWSSSSGCSLATPSFLAQSATVGLAAAILFLVFVAVLIAYTPVGRWCQSAVTRSKAVAALPAV